MVERSLQRVSTSYYVETRGRNVRYKRRHSHVTPGYVARWEATFLRKIRADLRALSTWAIVQVTNRRTAPTHRPCGRTGNPFVNCQPKAGDMFSGCSTINERTSFFVLQSKSVYHVSSSTYVRVDTMYTWTGNLSNLCTLSTLSHVRNKPNTRTL